MARLGMDDGAVEAAGKNLQSLSGQLEGLMSQIDRVVNNLPGIWDGPDAAQFVTEWWPEHKRNLTAVKDSVFGLGQSALNNVSEQRRVSGRY